MMCASCTFTNLEHICLRMRVAEEHNLVYQVTEVFEVETYAYHSWLAAADTSVCYTCVCTGFGTRKGLRNLIS